MFVVVYKGPFGFIKPYDTNRDDYIKSQNFLLPSAVKGIELYLFPELLKDKTHILKKIVRCKINFDNIVKDLGVIQSPLVKRVSKRATDKMHSFILATSCIERGLLHNVTVYVGFNNMDDALIASSSHIRISGKDETCYPSGDRAIEISDDEFDKISGWEFKETSQDDPNSILVGNNRYKNNEKIYGKIIHTK